MGIKSRALRPFCAIRVCVYLVNTHAHTHTDEIFGKYHNDMTLSMNNVPIMPRDEINEPQMLIFQQLFSVYNLKLSLACIFAKEGVLRSSDSPPPSFSSLSCYKALSTALECHFIATQWLLLEFKPMMCFMLGCTSSSFFLSPSNIKGNFQDHCDVDSLVLVVSNSFCLFPFGKHGKNVFCGLSLYLLILLGCADQSFCISTHPQLSDLSPHQG